MKKQLIPEAGSRRAGRFEMTREEFDSAIIENAEVNEPSSAEPCHY